MRPSHKYLGTQITVVLYLFQDLCGPIEYKAYNLIKTCEPLPKVPVVSVH